jgi:hypothetical protein
VVVEVETPAQTQPYAAQALAAVAVAERAEMLPQAVAEAVVAAQRYLERPRIPPMTATPEQVGSAAWADQAERQPLAAATLELVALVGVLAQVAQLGVAVENQVERVATL